MFSPSALLLTCVVEQAGHEGAVPEEGVRGGDVLKVALLEYRVFKHHGLHLQVEEPGSGQQGTLASALGENPPRRTLPVLLVVEVVALAVHLVFQGEVEGDVLHPLLGEGLGARLVLLLLDVLDHVREPHRQAVVAAGGVRVVRLGSLRGVQEGPPVGGRQWDAYLKDMVNQTAISMKVVRLYSGLKQARMLERI